ncbi:hypothetical protein [Streptomyces sp. NPDC093990]|uniref:hypothetical protein n=1 Tax=Streptomyces sp. NPDC093990 TaxID=3155306 RepID=UPI00341D4186
MGEDIRDLVEKLTARVATLEGTENFTARFKEQFAQALSAGGEFKKAVQGEISSWKAQQDAEQKKLIDPKWLPDNIPATGAKLEATGLKSDVFVGQFEYGLFKHEYSVTKFLEDREQLKRDRKIDEQLAELKRIDGTQRASIKKVRESIDAAVKKAGDVARQGDRALKEQIAALRKDLRAAERTAAKAEQRGTKAQALAKEAGSVSRAARTNANSAERKAQNALTQVSEVRKQVRTRTNEVERNTRAALRQVDSLRGQVDKGMQRVRALESGAKTTSQAVKGLRNDLNALERDLRR